MREDKMRGKKMRGIGSGRGAKKMTGNKLSGDKMRREIRGNVGVKDHGREWSDIKWKTTNIGGRHLCPGFHAREGEWKM